MKPHATPLGHYHEFAFERRPALRFAPIRSLAIAGNVTSADLGNLAFAGGPHRQIVLPAERQISLFYDFLRCSQCK